MSKRDAVQLFRQYPGVDALTLDGESYARKDFDPPGVDLVELFPWDTYPTLQRVDVFENASYGFDGASVASLVDPYVSPQSERFRFAAYLRLKGKSATFLRPRTPFFKSVDTYHETRELIQGTGIRARKSWQTGRPFLLLAHADQYLTLSQLTELRDNLTTILGDFKHEFMQRNQVNANLPGT